MQDFTIKTQSLNDFSTMSRAAFADLLFNAIGTTRYHTLDKKWIDETGPYKDVMTTLRTGYSFAWKDGFSDRYFQPDKTITIGEALYMIEVVNGK